MSRENPTPAQTEFWLENTEAALREWRKIEPQKVRLCEYRQGAWGDVEGKLPDCGTPACFGGWLPYFAHFQALGVTADSFGVPHRGRFEGLLVARDLFGNADLFDMRSHQNPYDHDLEMEIDSEAFDLTSDWALILNRLERQAHFLGTFIY